ncbi:MAG: DeoR/GlpR family DNA-binding transcription regulator [Alphaproteobacteria bacterium]|nr:DeoR/GlpR family DNA-binding transcription regulator [Alphaproteobacteria bacterium]
MHEIERHRLILDAVESQPVVTLVRLVELTGASEATVRRDVNALHLEGRLRKVRGGAEAVNPPQQSAILGRPFSINQTENAAEKRSIAKAAAALCKDGESIIINGGSTTYQMTEFLAGSRMQILTNSFAIAEHLVRQSRNTITVPGGAVYREHEIILSPFDNDVTRNFYAARMFMGAHAIGPHGVMEADPLLIQAEQKLINQADALIIMVDSGKFAKRSSLILCGLERVHTLITDSGISRRDAKMVEDAGVRLIIAEDISDAKGGATSAA